MPDALALFPLQQVLFPGGTLRLRIFEPRYLDLIKRCAEQGLPFGVVALIEGSEVREREAEGEGFKRERFHTVGTLAHLVEAETAQPGLMHLQARGGQRFELRSSDRLPHGLWVGDAALLDEDRAVPVPRDLQRLVLLLQNLVHTLELGGSAAQLPIQPPYDWDDCGWLSNRWAELLPLACAERQRLMALDNPLLRLELVADQLEALGISEA
ncbi:MAG: LON peptidase substrate-binding domain-containing protein [Paucibacter sp.]|nr:LON peptidase substrate-binding domain-containing protein [Roseateles sp.]